MSKSWKSAIQCCNPSKLKHQKSQRILIVLHSSSDYLGYSVALFPNQAHLWSSGSRRKGLSCCCEHDNSGLCSCCVRVKVAKDCQPTLWWSEENGRGRDCAWAWWLNGTGVDSPGCYGWWKCEEELVRNYCEGEGGCEGDGVVSLLK